MARHFLGIDIGGTKSAACLADETGQLIESRRVPTKKGPEGWESTVDRLRSTARALVRDHAIDEVEAVGISCGSPLDADAGVIQEPANLPGWKNVPIVDLFTQEFPSANVFLENDANAGALAEYAFGAGRSAGCRHMLFITFGTGLGAGLILNGQLYTGANGYAGEIGHIRLSAYGPAGCGKPGSFEGFCSGGGIEQLAFVERRAWFDETVLPYDGLDAKTINDGARSGDPLCLKIFDTVGEYLGRGLAIVLDVLNPELIVIGSVFARSEDLIREGMERAIRREARAETHRACRIVSAELDEDIGNFAAISIAYYRIGILEQVRKG